MEHLLTTIGNQAVNYAIRQGVALTSRYAVSQCSRLLTTVDDQQTYSRLVALQKQFDSKIKVKSQR